MQNEKLIDFLVEGSIAIPRLLINHYAKLGLNETEFALLIHVYSFISSGNPFPTPDELSNQMSCNVTKCTESLRSLMQKGFLSIHEDADHGESHLMSESYSLRPLWEKLAYLLVEEEQGNQKLDKLKLEAGLYSLFEKEFGRPLSPMESETLTLWIDEDGHEPLLIKTALRESVLSGKLNFKYIDRILFEWKKNGVKTVEQASQHGKKIRKHLKGQAPDAKQADDNDKISIPFYNWLDS